MGSQNGKKTSETFTLFFSPYLFLILIIMLSLARSHSCARSCLAAYSIALGSPPRVAARRPSTRARGPRLPAATAAAPTPPAPPHGPRTRARCFRRRRTCGRSKNSSVNLRDMRAAAGVFLFFKRESFVGLAREARSESVRPCSGESPL